MKLINEEIINRMGNDMFDTVYPSYITTLLGNGGLQIQVLNATITKQIKTFRENFDLTYSGILSTLKWWIEIKKEKMEDKNYGIAIVPYIYDQAKDYYYNMWKANQVNESLDLENYKPKIEVVNIPPPRVHNAPPKLMEFWKERE